MRDGAATGRGGTGVRDLAAFAAAGGARLPAGVRRAALGAALGPLARRLAQAPAPERRALGALLAEAVAAGDAAAALRLASTARREPDLRAEKIVSRRHRFVWLCVPKAASRSLIAALRAADPDAEVFRGRTLEEVFLARPAARGYPRFAFLRHPRARLASFHADKLAAARRGGAAHRWFVAGRHGLAADMDFAALCAWLGTPSGADAFADRHWLSQHVQVRDRDGRPPHLLGAVERLDDDWRAVAGDLGLPRVALPRLNARPPGAPRAPALDPAAAAALRRRYAADFALGGYADAPPAGTP